MDAIVRVNPAGGTLVEATPSYQLLQYAAIIPMAIMGVVTGVLFARTWLGVVGPVVFGSSLALHVLYIRQSNAALLRRERQPAYFIERLEYAIAAASTAPINAPAI